MSTHLYARFAADTGFTDGTITATNTHGPVGLVGVSLRDKDYAGGVLHFTPDRAEELAEHLVTCAKQARLDRGEKPELEVIPLPELIEGRRYVVIDPVRLSYGEPIPSWETGLRMGDVVTLLDATPDLDGEVEVQLARDLREDEDDFEYIAPEGLYLLPEEEGTTEAPETVEAVAVNNFVCGNWGERYDGLPPVGELPLEYVMEVVAYLQRATA